MNLLKFNLNDEVRVKIKDAGVERYVKLFNQKIHFEDQLSFNEFKSRVDCKGYHKVQLHWIISNFGNCGLGIANYIDLNLLFEEKDFKKGNPL